MNERQHKVVLIGAKGYERTVDDLRVDCFQWQQINKIPNIRDYDLVILNLLALNLEESTRDEVDWDTFVKLLDFHSAMDILENKGKIIVVGDPRFSIPLKNPPNAQQEFLAWTGAKFIWDSEPGDTIKMSQAGYLPEFIEYISRLKKWSYSLAKCELDVKSFASHYNLQFLSQVGKWFTLEVNAFCRNRYSYILAGQLVYQFKSGDVVVDQHGPIILLPEIDLSEDETLQFVLTNVCGIETNLSEPEWVNEFEVPGQKGMDVEITRIKSEIETLLNKLDQAEKERMECRGLLKLLYEREFALEPVVRDVLREFGAEVEEPVEKNKEDGWIVVNVGGVVFEGVLEIKSTKSDTFNEAGRKQLLDWIDRGRTQRGKEYKGIFIGNSAVDTPIENRKNCFEANWVKAAALSGICALKTQDLYCIYLLRSKGLMDMDGFWRDLFQTRGVFDMGKYYELLSKSANLAS